MSATNKNLLATLFSKKMLITFAFGFSSGLPAVLIGSNLKIWLTREGLSLGAVGFMSWVGVGIGLKFLWAPLMDRWSLGSWGRRRSWIAFSQMALMGLIIFLGTFEPKQSLFAMAVVAVLISFASATQDIAIDAYRRESLNDEEMGLGSSLYQYGYRAAMYVAGGLGLGLVGSDLFAFSWGQMYLTMGILMGVCLLITLLAPEPRLDAENIPRGFEEIIIRPFAELFSRSGAIYILLFTILFKFGDAIAGQMLAHFMFKWAIQIKILR
jgi:PAT family beta-lactamase induction signal transducer AmpG